MKKTAKLVAGVAALVLVATACGTKAKTDTAATPPADASATDSPTTPADNASAFNGCMVTDTGGIDDRSFNASSWQGLEEAKTALGITDQYAASASENDYVPNINAFVQQKCGIIVTVGFLMGDATETAAKTHTDQKFAIVDYSYDPALPNVLGLTFNTAEAGFLGGYLAAGMTKTGKVATYGGMKLPTVTIFMDGYADGVAYYNTKHNTKVQVLGWNVAKQDGTFTGDFTDQGKGQQTTQAFVQQGADIVFPVAGNVGLGSAKAAKDSGGKLNVIWVDTDGCVSAEQYCDVFLGSVVKGIAVAVKTATGEAKDGSFDGRQLRRHPEEQRR